MHISPDRVVLHEYINGELSKVYSFAFGLLILEALTGYGASLLAGSRYCNLLTMFEQDLHTASNLLRVPTLTSACAGARHQHKAERVGMLGSASHNTSSHCDARVARSW